MKATYERCNSLVVDLIPNNQVEIAFTMMLMILNLTLFRLFFSDFYSFLKTLIMAVADM